MSGLILLSQVGGASVTADIGLELSVVTAVVLGGTSLSGGRGGIVGTILAVLIAVGFDQLRVRLTQSVD